MDCATDLPVDVLSKIVSYKIGDPKYLKIKYCHIEALKRIQDKYKISRLGPKIARHLKSRKKKYILDDGWPESEKHVLQAALSMVVVKNSR